MAKKVKRKKGRFKKWSQADINTGGTYESYNSGQKIKVKRVPPVGAMAEYKARARHVDVERMERLFPTRFKGTPPGRKEAEDLIKALGVDKGHQKVLLQTEKRTAIMYVSDVVYIVFLDGLFGVIKRSIDYGTYAQCLRYWNADDVKWKLVVRHPNSPATSSTSSS